LEIDFERALDVAMDTQAELAAARTASGAAHRAEGAQHPLPRWQAWPAIFALCGLSLARELVAERIQPPAESHDQGPAHGLPNELTTLEVGSGFRVIGHAGVSGLVRTYGRDREWLHRAAGIFPSRRIWRNGTHTLADTSSSVLFFGVAPWSHKKCPGSARYSALSTSGVRRHHEAVVVTGELAREVGVVRVPRTHQGFDGHDFGRQPALEPAGDGRSVTVGRARQDHQLARRETFAEPARG